jgi:predicted dehydrogenase
MNREQRFVVPDSSGPEAIRTSDGVGAVKEVQVTAVCDVVAQHREMANRMVDGRYGTKDCKSHLEFLEVLDDPGVDAVLTATPDHWHAIIAIEAMKRGKDVYCEKPESLTVR